MKTTARRDFLRLAAIGPLAFGAVPLRAASRPNVIVILTDDQGYGDFSCLGNPGLKTPNLDRLHGESVRFTDFHAAPMCTPTRGQLLSGQDACRNRATSVTGGRAVLKRDLPTMANAFADGGYRTGLFGKWHLGDNYPYRPMDRGFQRAVYFRGYGLSSAPEFDNDYYNGRYRDQGVSKPFSGYCTDFWFSQAMHWMRERSAAKQPFFAYIPTNVPHGPLWVDPKYSAPYEKEGMPAKFFGMIANLDENIGKLQTFLRETGLRENTIVILMTDNGGTAGVNYFNAGMRGRKTAFWEGGHRVPCWVSWPAGKFAVATDIDVPAQVQDVLPTLIDLCELPTPANARFDGHSLAPLLRRTAKTLPDRTMVVQYSRAKLVKWECCVIWNKWRLVHGEELYDIAKDPGQAKNVAAANAGVVKRLRDYYESWWQGLGDVMNDFLPISIGAAAENPVELSSSDWCDVYCDNQKNVSDADGGPRGGPWSIFVESDGDYEISLSRWPPWLRLPLTAGRQPQKMTFGTIPGGKALPIAAARLTIAGQERAVRTKPTDTHAVTQVKLKKGTRTLLQAWFQDEKGTDLSGAFYATVRKV
ncbi:MAG: arylsulfatase [Bryobacterales bacterium]|nr:arylsulfatase [Bryobacterales bacterium]